MFDPSIDRYRRFQTAVTRRLHTLCTRQNGFWCCKIIHFIILSFTTPPPVLSRLPSAGRAFWAELQYLCVGCGHCNARGGGCLSCGAPMDPVDGSSHYMWGSDQPGHRLNSDAAVP